MQDEIKPKCRGCKTEKDVGFYIIGDDLEHPKPYCEKCIDDVYWKAMLELEKLNHRYK